MASANLVTATVTMSDVVIFIVFVIIPGLFFWWLLSKNAPKSNDQHPLNGSHDYTGLDDDDFY